MLPTPYTAEGQTIQEIPPKKEEGYQQQAHGILPRRNVIFDHFIHLVVGSHPGVVKMFNAQLFIPSGMLWGILISACSQI